MAATESPPAPGGATAGEEAARRSRRVPWADVGVVAALSALALAARLHTLPDGGLFHDDAWVALGVLKGGPGDLLDVGTNHPGFSALLMGWGALTGRSTGTLAYPALVAGTVAPAALYLLLRKCGCALAVAALLAAVLVVTDAHVVLSGRVKAFTAEVLLVTAVAAVLPLLARRRWRPAGALAWVVVAVAVGSFSAFSLVVTLVAGVVLVLHPSGDRRLRLAAVAVQAAIQAGYLAVVQGRFDSEQVELEWDTYWDGYIDLSANVGRSAGEVVEHLERVVGTFLDGPSWVATAGVALALVGLAGGALWWRGRLAARFLGLLMIVAFAGAVAGKVPFGARDIGLPPLVFGDYRITDFGSRTSLLLIPAVAVGLGAALSGLRSLAGRARPAFDVACLAAAVAVLVVGWGEVQRYPFPGSAAAARFVDEEVRSGGVVVLTPGSFYVHGAESSQPVEIRPARDTAVGYEPAFDDPGIVLVNGGPLVVARDINQATEGAERVLVHEAIRGIGGGFAAAVGELLTQNGFAQVATKRFERQYVSVWERTSNM